MATSTPTSEHRVSPSEAFWLWLKIGLLSFGGPAGQIALMHRTIVDEKGWLGEQRFLHALNYCMLLPGPEAQQLTVYVGWLLHGVRGGIVAGVLFVLPGALVILCLSILYTHFAAVPVVDGIFYGVKATVLAIVLHAIIRMSKRVIKKPLLMCLAAAGFISTFFLHLPFPVLVLGTGLLGWLVGTRYPNALGKSGHGDSDDESENAIADDIDAAKRRRTLLTAAVFAVLWVIPIILLVNLLGPNHLYTQESLFFSKLAIVTFGGAYAVLAYMTTQVVDNYAWLSTGQMMDGLGMAETTPGPLILVTQFVGFVAAYQNPGELSPLLAGTLGAALTLWVTFIPCFLWIFLGAPWVERLRGSVGISGALSAITAVVVGVIASLALWFGLHVLFVESSTVEGSWYRFDWPVLSSIDLVAFALMIVSAIAMIRFKVPVLWIVLGSALVGIGVHTLMR